MSRQSRRPHKPRSAQAASPDLSPATNLPSSSPPPPLLASPPPLRPPRPPPQPFANTTSLYPLRTSSSLFSHPPLSYTNLSPAHFKTTSHQVFTPVHQSTSSSSQNIPSPNYAIYPFINYDSSNMPAQSNRENKRGRYTPYARGYASVVDRYMQEEQASSPPHPLHPPLPPRPPPPPSSLSWSHGSISRQPAATTSQRRKDMMRIASLVD